MGGSHVSAETRIYADETVRAGQIDVEKNNLQIRNIELGDVTLGTNRFSLEITNESANETRLIIEWVANAGLSLGEDRNRRELVLASKENKKIEGEYVFQSLSPFAKLYIRIWEGKVEGAPLFQDRFHVGAGNPKLAYDLSKFGHVAGSHVHLYYLPGTLAAMRAREILLEREAGLAKIENMIGIQYQGTISFFFYPNMESKTADTLHTGEGWAFERIIVEVYNQEIHLDPFHEMTHIVTGALGSPPPMLDEGFAVYAAEVLGADALEYIVGPGRKVDEVVSTYKKQGSLKPLADLLALSNIGDSAESSVIEYPQSASFVKFLIETHGADTFSKIFSALKGGSDRALAAENIRKLEEITNKSLEELETLWLARLK